MSFVTANRWSQALPGRQTTADLRFIDALPVAFASPAAAGASARLTAGA